MRDITRNGGNNPFDLFVSCPLILLLFKRTFQRYKSFLGIYKGLYRTVIIRLQFQLNSHFFQSFLIPSFSDPSIFHELNWISYLSFIYINRMIIYRGYYTVARRYEWAKRTSEILFLPREHKIHMFEPTCSVLFIISRLNIQQKQKAGIVTSLNDTTLTKVTYGKYATRVPDEVAYGIFEWFSSK